MKQNLLQELLVFTILTSSYAFTSLGIRHHQLFSPKIVHQNHRTISHPVFTENNNKQSALNSLTTGESNDGKDKSDRLLGISVLLTVPLSWGTYAPVVKYVYEMNPPLPGFVFSAGYYMIASFTLTVLSAMMASPPIANDDDSQSLATIENSKGGENSSSLLPLQALAGLELGSYLFIGNCLQVVGLKTIPADRAAFLVQLTTIMVPLLQAGFAGDMGLISAPTWLACILAFIGVIIMGLDRPDVDVHSLFSSVGDVAHGLSFSGGDSLIILAAVSYSMHVIRLGKYAKFTSPLGLAASKATVEAVLSIGLVVALLATGSSTSIDFINDTSSEIQTYFGQMQDALSAGDFPPNGSGKALGACLWTGWITCAYTIYAQSFGQQRVNPTDANLIYTMQPVFSAIFAWVLLGESLGTFGYAGAALIGFALWVVTNSQLKSTEES
eukprot:scaffold4124_cov267-Chaetoceros_neogracile.AAC.22